MPFYKTINQSIKRSLNLLTYYRIKMDKSADVINNLEDFDDLPLIEGDIGDANGLGENGTAANK